MHDARKPRSKRPAVASLDQKQTNKSHSENRNRCNRWQNPADVKHIVRDGGLITVILCNSSDNLPYKMDGLLSALLGVVKRDLSCLVDPTS